MTIYIEIYVLIPFDIQECYMCPTKVIELWYLINQRISM